MQQGNNKQGVLSGMSWVDMGWGFLFIIGALSFISALVFKFDPLAAIGIKLATDEGRRMVAYLLLGVVGYVNMKEHPSDRPVNFIIALTLLVSLAGYNLLPQIDASEATQKAQQAINQAQTNARTGYTAATQQVQAYRPPAQQVARTDRNSYYNPFRANSKSGGTAKAKRCAQLLSKGNIQTYKANRCNTGARLPQNNIATCTKWAATGTMSAYQKQGCGMQVPSWKAQWCQLNVGDKGQNRAAWCR